MRSLTTTIMTEVITILNLGNDSKKRYSPTVADTRELLGVFKDDPLVTLTILLGSRIVEAKEQD